MVNRRCGSRTGMSRISSSLTRLKTVVVAPVPSPMEMTMAATNPGACRNDRIAYVMSWRNDESTGFPQYEVRNSDIAGSRLLVFAWWLGGLGVRVAPVLGVGRRLEFV